jgi:hypothetical protein
MRRYACGLITVIEMFQNLFTSKGKRGKSCFYQGRGRRKTFGNIANLENSPKGSQKDKSL